MATLHYCAGSDTWQGVHQGHDICIAGDAFASRLDALARSRFGMPWEDLGEEEYIAVLTEVRHDLGFWAVNAADGLVRRAKPAVA